MLVRVVAVGSLLAVLALGCKSKASPTATPTVVDAQASATPTPQAATAAPLTPADLALAKANRAFAIKLYQELRTAPGNLALSPASISIALAMLYGGAGGDTATEMQKTLHFEGPTDDVVRGWGRIGASLTQPSRHLKLRLANRLFGEATYAFEPAFMTRTREVFDAPLEPLDIKANPGAARARINAWVEERTDKRITQLVGPLPERTSLVLVNAIWFLGQWTKPFERAATIPEPFFAHGRVARPVPTMHRTGPMRIAHVGAVKVLELPYRGERTSMWIALPDERDGLEAVEAALTPAVLDAWAAAFETQSVLVSLPRFEINASEPMKLADTLARMGMPRAFDRTKADFTAIGKSADATARLAIDQVLHKAVVKVDERGTEAAAATAVVAGLGGAPPADKPMEFRADHPFLYVLIDRETGLPLFMGHLRDP